MPDEQPNKMWSGRFREPLDRTFEQSQRSSRGCVPALLALAATMPLLQGCRGKPEETVSEFKNGDFKIDVRTQEFHHSGVVNVDVCVTEASARKFPDKHTQCLLHGYDFSGLSVRWKAEQEVEISFESGRATQFSNYAIVTPKSSLPVEFHATLHEAGTYISR